MSGFQSIILPPLSSIYSFIARARLTAYRREWFSSASLPVPVISVGNLTTGGTGKTPLVDYVCRVVAGRSHSPENAHSKRVCVLTRGYGRANVNTQVVVSDGVQLLAAAHEAGDEPFLLAQSLLGIAAVICNRDRFAAGRWAIENLGTEIFVLDDGFQHLPLKRDLDIVAIDATNPWGNESLLPTGRLREPRSGLSRAGCIVITRTDQINDASAIKKQIERLAPDKPIFTSRMITSGIKSLAGEVIEHPLQPIAAFCGVGNPPSFFAQLRGEDLTPVLTRTFSDHHHYTQSDVDQLIGDAQDSGAQALVTTAKDAVKLSLLKLSLPCFVLEIRIVIDDEQGFAELLQKAI